VRAGFRRRAKDPEAIIRVIRFKVTGDAAGAKDVSIDPDD
jgi:hypothetical protein